MTIKVAMLGLGQAGSNICEIAELYQYRTAIMNTSPEDLESIQLVKSKLLVGRNGGAGKDRRVAKSDVKGYFKEITAFVNDKFRDSDIEMIYLVFSSGGGTGSGMGPMVIDILQKMVPHKKFGAIAVLPSRTESAVAQVNSIECLRELVKLHVPTFIVDNDKFSEQNPSMSRKQLYDTINNQIIGDFNAILNTKRDASKYGNIDGKDLIKILSTPGASIISTTMLNVEGLQHGQTLQKQIIDELQYSVYAPIEYDGVTKRMGFIFEVDDKVTKEIGYDEINREIGSPLEVFEGFYKPKEGRQTVTTIITGLSFPEGRMKDVTERLELSKDDFAAKKEYDLLSSTDTSWFSDMREETVVKQPTKKFEDEDLNDLFGKYD